MTKVPSHLPLEAIFRMSEEYRTFFSTPLQAEQRFSEKVPVEFVL